MNNDKPKTKTLYANGKPVGEIPTTGDNHQDMELARQFLKDKGLYKETTLLQAMYNQAVSFSTNASYLYEKDLLKAPRNGFSIAPFVVSSVFSIELYIKTLAQAHGLTLRGHKLVDLFDKLPAIAVSEIELKVPMSASKWELNSSVLFRDCLLALNNAFVEWRYLYEIPNTNEFRFNEAIFVMNVLHEACSEHLSA